MASAHAWAKLSGICNLGWRVVKQNSIEYEKTKKSGFLSKQRDINLAQNEVLANYSKLLGVLSRSFIFTIFFFFSPDRLMKR